ncbi:hypothetical protein FGIG_07256 [Fasciola gigantica]|uniref:Uncharacterized protein n=1 Tax=Fasciola gigantica TaxID=46835 RepID=A0A504YMX4_FASGI|nr:hypothetical protein FGIG_07256 [Fasciola gigantica]
MSSLWGAFYTHLFQFSDLCVPNEMIGKLWSKLRSILNGWKYQYCLCFALEVCEPWERTILCILFHGFLLMHVCVQVELKYAAFMDLLMLSSTSQNRCTITNSGLRFIYTGCDGNLGVYGCFTHPQRFPEFLSIFDSHYRIALRYIFRPFRICNCDTISD